MKTIIFILAFSNVFMLFLQRQWTIEILIIGLTGFFYAMGIFSVADKNDELQKQINLLKERKE